jgi:hypothetical protein
MSLIRELSQEYTKEKLDQALLTEDKEPTYEEMIQEYICEEIYQEDPYEVSHDEDPDKTLEDEVVHICEEVIKSNDTCQFMENPLGTIDNHIEDFICVWEHGWDISCFGFDKYPIYDIEGNF